MTIRPMTPADSADVVAFVHGLAAESSSGVAPRMGEAELSDVAFGTAPLVQVTVADFEGRLIGACLTLVTYSTWRGARGLYVVDLFVDPAARGGGIGERLLRAAAARGRALGARFIKLEVETDNVGAARFYERLGFTCRASERLFFLEAAEFDAFSGDAGG